MTDEIHTQIIKLEDKFLKAVKNTLDLPIRPGSSQHKSDLSWNDFQFGIPTRFETLRDTKYYCKETKLLHFTSLELLFSIIIESSIRMYNLLNSKDPDEYVLAGKIFKGVYDIIGNKNPSKFKDIKSESFITSFTDEKNIFSSYHWEHYGHNYKGVAIEFEIKPEYHLWNKFILSRTFYGKLTDFEELFNAWREIQSKSPNCSYDIKMEWLLSLYKDKKYTDEDEIRLFAKNFDGEYGFFFKKHLFPSINSNTPELNLQYFKLPVCDKNWNLKHPLCDDLEQIFWETVPKLRISKIYIGPDLHFENWKEFGRKLRKLVNEKTGNYLGENDIQRLPKGRIV